MGNNNNNNINSSTRTTTTEKAAQARTRTAPSAFPRPDRPASLHYQRMGTQRPPSASQLQYMDPSPCPPAPEKKRFNTARKDRSKKNDKHRERRSGARKGGWGLLADDRPVHLQRSDPNYEDPADAGMTAHQLQPGTVVISFARL